MSGWPPVGSEERPWTSSLDVPRRWQATFSGPYRAAVVPDIGGLEPALSSTVIALADEATAELARFDAEMGADIAPFAAILLRSESAASSRIERVTASAKAIAQAELG
ncbi:MAG: Fic family protein, partial [Actinomycetota bacterium]